MNSFGKIYITLKSIKSILSVFLLYFGLTKGKALLKMRNGTKLFVRSGTTDLAEAIIVNSNTEYPSRYYPINKNPIIVDVGGGIGEFTVFVEKMCQPLKPIIYSIEPDEENYKIMIDNLRLNNLPIDNCHKIALSHRTGIANLLITKQVDSHKLINVKTKDTVNVQTLTLHDFVARNKLQKIDLLKIDIEGEEHKLINEAISFIKTSVRLLMVEVHNLNKESNIKTFQKFVRSNGLVIREIILGRTLVIENPRLIL